MTKGAALRGWKGTFAAADTPVRRWAAAVVATACLALLAGVPTASGQQGPKRALDLDKFRLTFSEEFDALSVSAHGPGTRWIAHTPWNGDFGDAAFADPSPGFPFTVDSGVLRIEARKDAAGKWQSGLLASADASGAGFSQQFGYFEMRAKLPPGPGLWPAFWLVSNKPVGPPVEIDVLEHYGAFPQSYESTLHIFNRYGQGKSWAQKNVNMVPPGSLYSDFHTYGALVDPRQITIYLDRKPVWAIETPPEHNRPLMVLLNLALGGGWPITDTPSPSFMYVDYVRAYDFAPAEGN